ncbi:MAG: amidohydrolase family protein [Kosmotogaceae bacterium]
MIVKDVSIFTNDGSFIEKGYIKVTDGMIEVVSEGTPPNTNEEVYSFPGKLLMPGLVNSHTHIYSAFSRGMPLKNFSPNTFTELLEQMWWKLDSALTMKGNELSAYLTAIESTKSGMTTLIDHHSSPNAVKGSLDTIASAVNKAGLRCSTGFEVSDRNGKIIRDKSVEENLRFAGKKNNFRAPYIGLHASFTLSDETLKLIADSNKKKIPIHVHVAEGPEDEENALSLYGKRVVERFNDFDLLNENSILVHCIHTDEKENEIIKKSGCYVVINPQSNMNNGVGFPDWKGKLYDGIKICLGNDGFGFNLFIDSRFLILGMHNDKKDPRVSSPDELKKICFGYNYELASRIFDIKMGKIKKGYVADFAIYDYDPPTILDSSNFFGHLFFGIGDNPEVTDVFVNGRPVMLSGKNLFIDEKKLYEECRKYSTELWTRL